MTTVLQFSRRRVPAAGRPGSPVPLRSQSPGFDLTITPGGRHEWATPHGTAYRLGRTWFITNGDRTTAVTVTELIAQLDHAEHTHQQENPA